MHTLSTRTYTELQTLKEVPTIMKTAGRRMQIGKWCYDTVHKRFAVFAGYCADCNAKQFRDRDEITQLFKFVRQDEKTLIVRVIKHLVAIRKV